MIFSAFACVRTQFIVAGGESEEMENVCGLTEGVRRSGGAAPRFSGDEARDGRALAAAGPLFRHAYDRLF